MAHDYVREPEEKADGSMLTYRTRGDSDEESLGYDA